MNAAEVLVRKEVLLLRRQLDAALRRLAEVGQERDQARAELAALRDAQKERVTCLTVKDMAKRLGMCAKTITMLIQSGELPCTKIGGQWRITEEAFWRWFKEGPANQASEELRNRAA